MILLKCPVVKQFPSPKNVKTLFSIDSWFSIQSIWPHYRLWRSLSKQKKNTGRKYYVRKKKVSIYEFIHVMFFLTDMQIRNSIRTKFLNVSFRLLFFFFFIVFCTSWQNFKFTVVKKNGSRGRSDVQMKFYHATSALAYLCTWIPIYWHVILIWLLCYWDL